jgi:hypothetical protein
MSTLVCRSSLVCVGLASLLGGALGCEGSDLNDGQSMTSQDQLAAKVSPQTLKRLARNFRVSAVDPLLVVTRSGENFIVPLSSLQVEVELAPSPVAATATRAPVLVAPEIPATPARRAQPSTFTAEVPCDGVATRARVPVPTVTFPEVPPDQVPRAVRVPSIVVAPAVEGMPVVATRVRVPVQEVEVPPTEGARRRRRVVTLPEITMGLINDAEVDVARSIEVQVPSRAADEASFNGVRVNKN